MVNFQQALAFDRDGFVLTQNMFNQAEVDAVLAEVRRRRATMRILDLPDHTGRSATLYLIREITEDIFGALMTSPRLINSARILLRDNISFWHSTISFKDPGSGAWEWHQEYRYFYDQGCLYPRLLGAMVVLEPATRSNGCLRVISGSHLLGRLNHESGYQAVIESDRLAAVQRHLPVHELEAMPGDVIFFHCNTLHSSGPNESGRARTAFTCWYNALSNIAMFPNKQKYAASIQPSADDAILRFADLRSSGVAGS
jgi:hypothetical protein